MFINHIKNILNKYVIVTSTLNPIEASTLKIVRIECYINLQHLNV